LESKGSIFIHIRYINHIKVHLQTFGGSERQYITDVISISVEPYFSIELADGVKGNLGFGIGAGAKQHTVFR
jgi:hypothetical protein